jgi:hypothetical protein
MLEFLQAAMFRVVSVLSQYKETYKSYTADILPT